MTCFGMLSSGILELHNVEGGFWTSTLKSILRNRERYEYSIAGNRPSRNILSLTLLVCSIR
jgi:hypothetical protein